MAEHLVRRLARLRARLQEQGFDAALLANGENRRYLSGFTGSSGYLLVSQSRALLATDFRYFEQVKREAPSFELFPLKTYGAKWLIEATSLIGVKKVAFEAMHLPFASYRQFTDAAGEADSGIEIVPQSGLVETLRATKEAGEIAAIAAAAALVHGALDELKSALRPGMSEKSLAWRLERLLREKGSEALPFEIIVASGPNSALPHARPSEREVVEGEPIVIDVGARVSGYCCDVTRTLFIGTPAGQLRKIYDIVFGAQQAAMALLESHMTGSQADSLARTVIEQAGYAEHFGHGLGHGVGLETHEAPRLGPSSADHIENGMAFTIEPGIYLAGSGGVRIEDTVVMENGRPRVLP